MLEIFILIGLTNRIGKIVEAKGHKSTKYKWMTAGLWFGGEILGAILGALITGGDQSAQCGVYVVALLGAAVGAWISNSIANNLEALPGYPKSPESAIQTDSSKKLQELKKMLDDGLITAQEYETKKAEILSKM